VEPSRKIGAVVVAADADMRAALEGEAAVLALLAKLEPAQVHAKDGRRGAAALGVGGQPGGQQRAGGRPWTAIRRAGGWPADRCAAPVQTPSNQVHIVASADAAGAAAPAGASVALVVREGLQVVLPMAGLFDVAKETARLEKQKAKVRGRGGGGAALCRFEAPLQGCRARRRTFFGQQGPGPVDSAAPTHHQPR
jgi:valyl-tRNA synthetase